MMGVNIMTTTYETDVVLWANEQARLIRAGQFDQLDLEHIAEEIEDVGKSERRELYNRLSVLLMHLLKWQFQSHRRSAGWKATITEQRYRLERLLRETPSLKVEIEKEINEEWRGAILSASADTGLPESTFPTQCTWTVTQILGDWLPTES
jgi:Domain of unknown function DUF29